MEDKQRESVVYLYVKEFEYKDQKYAEMMNGHPKTGRIYRALHDTENNLYRIILEEEDKNDHGLAGMIIQKLQNDDVRWTSDIVEIDGESLINYDIVSDDFVKLAKWQETENKDIDHLRIDAGEASVHQDPATGITSIVFEDGEEEYEDITANLADLSEIDFELAKAVDKTVEGIMHYLGSITEGRPDLTTLTTNHERHGKGVNVGLAIEALSDYLNHDPSSKGTLNKAVYYLLREMARINK